MKKSKKRIKKRRDFGFAFFLKSAWEVLVEEARTRRALRILAKQEWSVEFLTTLVVKAEQLSGKSVELDVHGPGGTGFTVRNASTVTKYDDAAFDRAFAAAELNELFSLVNRG